MTQQSSCCVDKQRNIDLNMLNKDQFSSDYRYSYPDTYSFVFYYLGISQDSQSAFDHAANHES